MMYLSYCCYYRFMDGSEDLHVDRTIYIYIYIYKEAVEAEGEGWDPITLA